MLFKVPVVALNNSAISETLHDNGVLLENNTNLEEIAAKIVELLLNKSFRNLIVNKQYDYIMNYTKHDFRKSFFQELDLI
jgi:glycosyltransferase involved in cell wall biosynthesis